MTETLTPMVVTTEHRGVFFGYGTPTREKLIELKRARMCVLWSTDVHGVLGLAANGPSKECRISPAAPSILLHGITSIMTCSDAAVKAWESESWKK